MAHKVDPTQVEQVGFVPLDQLLQGIDVVVLAGGSGSVTGALSRGLPMFACPMVFDQFHSAERAAATGAAVIASTPSDVGSRVVEVLAERSYRTRAQALAAQITAMNTPDAAWQQLLERVTRPRRTLNRPAGPEPRNRTRPASPPGARAVTGPRPAARE